MKILFLLPEYYPHSGGGISTYYLQYIRALAPHCHSIKVIVGSGYAQGGQPILFDGAEVEYLQKDVFERYITRFSKFSPFPELQKNLASAWAMAEQAAYGEGFDLIECTDFGLGFVPWAIRGNKPIITRLHGSSGQIALHEGSTGQVLQNDFFRQTELSLLPLCNALVSHSSANRLEWENLLQRQIHHILPVFDRTLQKPVYFELRRPYGAVTARIQVWKGPIELCLAASAAKPKVFPIEWYGRDFSYREGQTMAQNLKMRFPDIWGKTIIPKQPLVPDEIAQVQRTAKFGLICSTWDMFNFTCPEFMALGTPVICSNGAGASELIDHGVNGLKYDAKNIESLAECLERINEMGASAFDKMAEAAIDTVRHRLSPEKLIPLNLTLYNSLMRDFKPEPANEFLSSMYSPADRYTPFTELLDRQPLSDIMNYILRRSTKKIKF